MNMRIKIIKRHGDVEAEDKPMENRVDSTKAQPGENKTREMVNTVKSWIAELNERKRIQPHSFSPLPIGRNVA